VAKRLLGKEAIQNGKEQLLEIVSMLTGLVNSLMTRIREEPEDYFGVSEQEQEKEQERNV